MPLVSVVIPTFNRCSLVLEAVDSVITQQTSDIEVLVVDDASEDDTQACVNERYSAMPSVRYLRHTTNRGVSAARNTGIDAARGRFLAFLDSDDIALPGRLDRQIARFAADPRLIAVGGAIALTDPNLVVREVVRYPEQDLDIRWYGLFTLTVCLTATMVALPALRETGVRFDERIAIAEDADFMSALLPHGAAANLPEPVTKLRKHSGNSVIGSPDTYRQTLQRCVMRNFAAIGMPMELSAIQEIYSFLRNDDLPKAGIERRRWAAIHARACMILDAVQCRSITAPDCYAALVAFLDSRLQVVPDGV